MKVIILQSMGFFMWKLLEGFYDEEKKCIVLCVLFESKYYIVDILRILYVVQFFEIQENCLKHFVTYFEFS